MAVKATLVIAGINSSRYKKISDIALELVSKNHIPSEKIFILTNNLKSLESIDATLKEEKALEKVKAYEFVEFCKEIFDLKKRNLKFCQKEKHQSFIRSIIEENAYPFRFYWECSKLILKIKKFQKQNNQDIELENYSEIGTSLLNIDAEEFLKRYPFESIKKILDHYESKISKLKYVDKIDLLFEVREILKNKSEIKNWNEKMQAIIFDNFQDIDKIAFDILTSLSKDNRSIYCLGDPDEGIYVFKGNLHNPFQDFLNFFPDAEILKFEESLWVNPYILEAANHFINVNQKNEKFLKNLNSRFKSQDYHKINLTNYDNSNDEAEEVAKHILRIVNNDGVQFKTIAVIFRNWNLGRKIHKVFNERKIPFFSEELKKILNKEHSQDFLAYLNIAFEKDEKTLNESVLRIINKPFRGIDRTILEKANYEESDQYFSLLEFLEREKDDFLIQEFLGLVKEIQSIALDENISLRDRFKRILERVGILSYLSEFDNSLIDEFEFLLDEVFKNDPIKFKDFKAYLDLFDNYESSKDVVYLSTIHTCKSRTFPFVFLISLNDGILPSMQSLIKDDVLESLEEERRVFYVGLTTAKKQLFLSSWGEKNLISRFVKQIESHLLRNKLSK